MLSESERQYAQELIGPDFIEVVGWSDKKMVVRVGEPTEFEGERKNVHNVKIARPEVIIAPPKIARETKRPIPFKVECPNCAMPYTIWGNENETKFLKCDDCGQEFIKTLRELA